MSWQRELRADPLDWLLEPSSPAVRHLALRDLLDAPADDRRVADAQRAAMTVDPIASILAAQTPEGCWPGQSTYLPKYTATVWQLTFLDQMGADPRHPQVRAACEFALGRMQSPNGAFGAQGRRSMNAAPPSGAIHCLNGNILAAVIGLGWLEDERTQRSVGWQSAAIVGDPSVRYYASTPGPGFRCGPNDGEGCAWGATKALLALGRIPPDRRSAMTQRAIDAGVEFLLGSDPALADYPRAHRDLKTSGSWFKLGFPLAYVTDVLQVLEAVVGAGAARDPRLSNAIAWLLARQTPDGRWTNEYTYAGKMIVDVDRPHEPSKWVTLRACRVLKAVAEA